MSVWTRTRRLAATAALVGFGLIVGLVLASTQSAVGIEAQETAPAVMRDGSDIAMMVPQGAFIAVAEQLRAEVVFVEATRPQQRRRSEGRFGRLFEDFFGNERGRPDFEDEDGTPDFDSLQRSQGSGVLVSADGYILTNAHVVAAFNPNTEELELAAEVQVTTFDERLYDAEIVGADLGTDIALLKIRGRDLEYAKLGDSDRVKVGEWVMAVGAPFGLQNTVSAGIVSALGRTRLGGMRTVYQDFMQTDAAINPGNSGGPLVNLRAEVIGINTAIATNGGISPSFSGVGFAVPINLARRVMDQLREHGRVIRGYLGVSVRAIDRDLRAAYDLDPRTRGALVFEVTKGGPAEEAGLLADDIVVGMDGARLRSQQDFLQRIAAHAPGDRVKLTVLRVQEDGSSQKVDVSVNLSERPEEAEILANQSPGAERRERDNGDLEEESSDSDVARNLGMRVTELTPRLARQLRLPDQVDGVVVTGVARNSPTAMAGIEQGDVIIGLNRVKVLSVDSFAALLAKHGGPSEILALRIYDVSRRQMGLVTLRVPRN